MTGTIVGIKKVNFKNSEGKDIIGNNLYIITEIANNKGDGYEFLFAPQKKNSGFFTEEQVDELGLYDGAVIDFGFNKYGSIDKTTIRVTN